MALLNDPMGALSLIEAEGAAATDMPLAGTESASVRGRGLVCLAVDCTELREKVAEALEEWKIAFYAAWGTKNGTAYQKAEAARLWKRLEKLQARLDACC